MSSNAESITHAIKLYRHPLSGHSHRVELFLSLLGLPFELVDVDLVNKAHKAEPFLKMNPFGQVPVIDDGGVVVADSNAILVYLANKYDDGRWLPRDAVGAAAVQRWLSIAAGPIAYGPATARLITVFGAPFNADEVIARAHLLLSVIEKVLGESPFLAGESPT
ncbi:MAG TPA: glutathione S-transferase, partial [Burkholderiales bacterium]|nr:glutathione S-transferase [Burkholderiales bacterium]